MSSQVNLPATYVDVFKNGISVDVIFAEGLLVDVTYHSLIPIDEGNRRINLFCLFGSNGTGIFISKSAILYLLYYFVILLLINIHF
jgi:hypothetical protein